MSLRRFEKVLHLKLQPSRRLAVVLILLHIAAFASVLASLESHEYWLWLLLPLIIFSFVYYFIRYIRSIHSQSVISVTQTRQGDWSLRLYNDENIEAELCDDSYKHPLLVILNFKTKQGRFSVPLFPDALESDFHRLLRCRLTLSRPAEKEKLLRR